MLQGLHFYFKSGLSFVVPKHLDFSFVTVIQGCSKISKVSLYSWQRGQAGDMFDLKQKKSELPS